MIISFNFQRQFYYGHLDPFFLSFGKKLSKTMSYHQFSVNLHFKVNGCSESAIVLSCPKNDFCSFTSLDVSVELEYLLALYVEIFYYSLIEPCISQKVPYTLTWQLGPSVQCIQYETFDLHCQLYAFRGTYEPTSFQLLMLLFHEHQNGMHSLCPAVWSKHRRWLFMSMLCLNPPACVS